jgi:hypothetical protein
MSANLKDVVCKLADRDLLAKAELEREVVDSPQGQALQQAIYRAVSAYSNLLDRHGLIWEFGFDSDFEMNAEALLIAFDLSNAKMKILLAEGPCDRFYPVKAHPEPADRDLQAKAELEREVVNSAEGQALQQEIYGAVSAYSDLLDQHDLIWQLGSDPGNPELPEMNAVALAIALDLSERIMRITLIDGAFDRAYGTHEELEPGIFAILDIREVVTFEFPGGYISIPKDWFRISGGLCQCHRCFSIGTSALPILEQGDQGPNSQENKKERPSTKVLG